MSQAAALQPEKMMDKNVAGLIGAVGALMASAPAQVATAHPLAIDTAMQASSYADLLKPIPNALAVLKASAEAPVRIGPAAPPSDGEARVQEAQVIVEFGPRRPYRRYYHHHHHHHHHYYRHHHHHHHHHDE
jgi:ABC-type nickel/cobalt efflux system permease component RcnA